MTRIEINNILEEIKTFEIAIKKKE